MSNDYLSDAHGIESELIARRRDFHRNPELGFEEVRTAGIVAAELRRLDLEVQTGIAKTGVVGLLKGARPGPTLLLRFDMDALAISEANTTEYVSTVPGKMHACGHDAHTAIGLAVAQIMARHRTEMAGTLRFVFQPAEEGQGGAAAMVLAGVLENPKPDAALGVHMWNGMQVGMVGVTPGSAMAGSDRFDCMITGVGGHGGLPHLASDPLVASAHAVTALQTTVSRNVNPLESAVVTVASLHAGDAFNAIPEYVQLNGTIRTFKPEVRETVLRRTRAIIQGIVSALGCVAEFSTQEINPPVVNDPNVTAIVKEAAGSIVGAGNVRSEWTTGSEDFAFMLQQVPGCFFFVGSANAVKGLTFAHHNPRFDVDESALALAAAIMCSAASRFVLND